MFITYIRPKRSLNKNQWEKNKNNNYRQRRR